jgi:hypothetical protein
MGPSLQERAGDSAVMELGTKPRQREFEGTTQLARLALDQLLTELKQQK